MTKTPCVWTFVGPPTSIRTMSTRKISSAATTPLFTQQDVTEKVGIKYDTLKSWLRAGLVRPAYTVDGRPLFTAADVEQVRQVKQQRELDRKQAMNLLRLPEAR